MGQVISNLISNSIKFIFKEGIILTSIEKMKNNNNNKNEVIESKDNGIGIDTEIFPKLFSKFATKVSKVQDWGYIFQKVL